jgi:AraC-like DNA-binding protein/ligand-binding sensor protein
MPSVTFEHLAALPVLNDFCHLMWQLFSVHMCLFSPDGVKQHRIPDRRSEFCDKMISCPAGYEHCFRCDQESFHKAAAQRRPFSYRCHAGLTEFVIPLCIEDEAICYLMGGQVLDKSPTRAHWANTRKKLLAEGVDPRPLAECFKNLPVLEASREANLLLLMELVGNYIAQGQYDLVAVRQDQAQRAVQLARAFISNHAGEPLKLETVAGAIHVSRRSLTRFLKQETGRSFVDLLQESRVRRACREMEDADKQCAAIAFAAGFGSIHQFNRVFKKWMGMPPLQWRQKHRPGASR